MSTLSGRRFFCSWSGGKDCCLALHRAAREGAVPVSLVTMLREDGERSRSHGLPLDVLRDQADAMGVRLITRTTSWDGYRERFLDAIAEARACGSDLGVFGDIDLEEHRQWVSEVCSEAGVEPLLPLWMGERKAILDELLGEGYVATIVAVRDESLGPDYLGKALSTDIIRALATEGIDLSGEGGEYHTVVTDGPAFSRPVRLEMGKVASKDGYSFLEVSTLGNALQRQDRFKCIQR